MANRSTRPDGGKGWTSRDSSPTCVRLVGSFEYNVAIAADLAEVVDSANRYIQETKPFKLAKTDLEACRAVLVNLADCAASDRRS